MRKIFLFIIALIPWFISGIFMNDNSFYQTLNLPFFALPGGAYGIIWTILYILIAISIYKIYTNFNFKIVVIYELFNIILIH